jgi:isoquinoline 1-oxidoreductase beta subunit
MLAEFAAKKGAVADTKGDVEGALSGARKTLSATFEVPFLAHATMEPMNCTAHVRKDGCEIWVPTQNAQAVQRTAAALTGLPPEKILVHTTFLGGGFGRRSETDFVEEAVQTSRAIGAPVQVVWTREDDVQHDFYRPVSLHKLSAGLDGGGRVIAFKHRVVAPSIGAQNAPDRYPNGLDRGAVEGATEMPYEIPNLLIDYVMANTAVPIGYWRSVFPSQTVFALESFIDELAHAAGADPFEFRRSMMESSPKMKRVLELAAGKAGWGTPLPRGRFRGIAFSPPAFFHTPVAQVAEVSIGKGGTIHVHRVVSAIDCGIAVNPTGVEAQMESGIAYGMTAALKGKITIDRGRVVQSNFDDYPLLTIGEMPVIETHIVPSTDPPTGTGEPGLPAVAPAIANAVFAATGRRLRSLPLTL